MYKQAGVSYMQMNTEDPALSDVNVRKAINIGVDRETLAKVLNDVVNPEYGFISAAQAGYSPEKAAAMAEEYKFDAEAAKALLKEAGYEDTNGDGFVDKDGKNLTIEYLTATDVATSRATAPVIQEQLKAIGIDLQITEYESAYIKQLQRENDYQMAARRYVWNDTDIAYYVFTEASGYPWSDPEVSAALEEARYIVDPAERIKGYEKFHDELMKELPAVALYSDNYCVASTKDVKGLVITNDGRSIFNDVTK
jgi:peptide/nickel transport system substrate-binding protein